MEEIKYRNGKIEDCAKIASGICLASGGIMDFLAQALPNEAIEGWLAKGLAEDEPGNSFRHAVIAEVNGETAGVVYCYPSELFGLSEDFKKSLGAENAAHVESFFSSRVEESMFLDSIFVWPKWRRRGIAEQLIAQVMQRARAAGLKQVSLMVFADNTKARSVYERGGFSEVKEIDLKRHPLIAHDGGALLLAVNVE